MQKSMLKKLCCPIDKSDLHIDIYNEDETGEVLEGLMVCPTCKRYCPIIYSIPIMTPDEYRQKALEAPMTERWGIDVGKEEDGTFLLENHRPLLK